MDYYQCSIEALRQELQRRDCPTYGSHDLLSEGLRADDDERGSEVTTVITEHLTTIALHEVNLVRPVEFSQPVPANELVDQRIMSWNLNTFFPTLQLFFESGLSCTIDGGQLPGAIIGLDSKLRFRLTDCTYEEQGRLTRGMLSEKFARSGASIRILEAAVAQRTSIAVKPIAPTRRSPTSKAQDLEIVHEVHTVIGLRLSGMNEMGYIWAKAEMPSRIAERRVWGDVRLADLRDDIPAPSLGLAADLLKPGGELRVVEKGSMIQLPEKFPGGLNGTGRLWI